jgi:hypothetical protein
LNPHAPHRRAPRPLHELCCWAFVTHGPWRSAPRGCAHRVALPLTAARIVSLCPSRLHAPRHCAGLLSLLVSFPPLFSTDFLSGSAHLRWPLARHSKGVHSCPADPRPLTSPYHRAGTYPLVSYKLRSTDRTRPRTWTLVRTGATGSAPHGSCHGSGIIMARQRVCGRCADYLMLPGTLNLG